MYACITTTPATGIYDLMFLMHALHGPLPRDYLEFKAQVRRRADLMRQQSVTALEGLA
jgi:hypothetical protein